MHDTFPVTGLKTTVPKGEREEDRQTDGQTTVCHRGRLWADWGKLGHRQEMCTGQGRDVGTMCDGNSIIKSFVTVNLTRIPLFF